MQIYIIKHKIDTLLYRLQPKMTHGSMAHENKQSI